MPRGSRLSSEEKAQIRALHQAGLSNRRIAKEIGRSHCVVCSYLRNPETYGSGGANKHQRKLSAREERQIWKKASNSTLSLKRPKIVPNHFNTHQKLRREHHHFRPNPTNLLSSNPGDFGHYQYRNNRWHLPIHGAYNGQKHGRYAIDSSNELSTVFDVSSSSSDGVGALRLLRGGMLLTSRSNSMTRARDGPDDAWKKVVGKIFALNMSRKLAILFYIV
ncbi:hypothetical protein COOONC_04186 [Cooperia oncophora]